MDVEKLGGVAAGSYNAAEAVTTTAPVSTEMVQEAERVQKSEVASPREKFKEEEKQAQQKERAVSQSSIDDAVSKANRKMEKTRCEYSYHEKTNRVSIKVIDEESNKVIREIPPEKSLDMLQKMWEMAGILVDEKR